MNTLFMEMELLYILAKPTTKYTIVTIIPNVFFLTLFQMN